MDKIPGEELIKAGIEKVGEPLYKDAVQPIVQPAAKQLGQAADTILGLLNTILMPIALVNLRVKAIYDRVHKKLEEGVKEIPPERRVEPPLYIVIPVIETVKSVEDKALQNMFVELLLSSMDSERQSKAHRAFVKILEEMSSYDAWMLKQIHAGEYDIAVCHDVPKKYTYQHGKEKSAFPVLPVVIAYWKDQICCHQAGSSIDNLLRLKLINVDRFEKKYFISIMNKLTRRSDEDINGFALRKYGFKRYDELEYRDIEIFYDHFMSAYKPSYMYITSFGADFCRTCIPKTST